MNRQHMIPLLFSNPATIANRILATDNLTVYFLKDTALDSSGAGGAVNSAPSGSGYNGAHTSVTLGASAGTGYRGQGYPAEYNGSSSLSNVFTASLGTAFDGQLFSILTYVQLTDTPSTKYVVILRRDGDNLFTIRFNSGTEVEFLYIAATTIKSITHTFASQPTAYVKLAATVSLTDDRFRAFVNDTQVNELSGLGTFAGDITLAAIGAANLVPAGVLPARIHHLPIWSDEKTPGELAIL